MFIGEHTYWYAPNAFNFQSIFTCILPYLIPFPRLQGESLARLLLYNVMMMSELAGASHLQKSTCYF